MAQLLITKWETEEGDGTTVRETGKITFKTLKVNCTYVITRRTPVTVGVSITIMRGDKLQGRMYKILSSTERAKQYCESHAQLLSKQLARADFGWN